MHKGLGLAAQTVRGLHFQRPAAAASGHIALSREAQRLIELTDRLQNPWHFLAPIRKQDGPT